MKSKKYITWFFIMLIIPFYAANVSASPRTFGAGSYIISADSCWQPNNDPATSSANGPECDTDKDDQSIFQLYGMLYALLDTGDIPDKCMNNDGTFSQQIQFGFCKQLRIYWVIDKDKTDPQDPDLTISGNINPLVNIYNSTALAGVGDSSTSVKYKGGVFIIDGNDLTSTEFNAIKDKFPEVKLHKSSVPFSGNVDKILIGRPPKVAVLNEGASDVLENYIRAAGNFSWQGTVFQYVDGSDILEGCLEDPVPATCKVVVDQSTNPPTEKTPDRPFQLLWAPHWIVEKTFPSSTDQDNIIQAIRDFLERGNAGFFECASIESLEGSQMPDGTLRAGNQVSTGGFLISNASSPARIDTNSGCSDTKGCGTDYVVSEDVPFWLVQCGGWNYDATGGHVHNMRPAVATNKNYTYLTTQTTDDPGTAVDDRFIGAQLTRFKHDDPAKVDYDPGPSDYYVYDYLLGGRINGSPTQGYVVYFPGHKYIDCSNNTTFNDPPARTIELQFDNPLPAGSDIEIELVHSNCTQGTNCPKILFDLGGGIGVERAADDWVDLNAEFAEYDSDNNTFSGIFFISAFDEGTATQLQITDLYITFDGNAGSVNLDNVVDLTKRLSLCAPRQTSNGVIPIQCSMYQAESLTSLQFSGDVSDPSLSPNNEIILSIGGLTATYDLDFGLTTSASDASLAIDMSNATYDSTTNTLRDIRLRNLAACGDYTMNDITVTYPNKGTQTLQQIFNDTTSETICTPCSTVAGNPKLSIASCADETCLGLPPAASEESIQIKVEFKNAYDSPSPSTITLAVEYDCGASCSGTVTAAYDTSNPPGGSALNEDANFRIDMSNAVFDKKKKKLQNIFLTNKDNSKQMLIDRILVTFDGSKLLKKIKDETNKNDICDFGKNGTGSIAACDPVPNYILSGGGGGGAAAWSYVLKAGMCDYYISPYLSSCDIDWNKSNTCGIKYVLNTLLALKFQLTSSEFIKTQPIVKDSIMYQASFDYPIYRGHLKKYQLPTNDKGMTLLWNAADAMPDAGISGFPTKPIDPDGTAPRYIFTNSPGTNNIIEFDADNDSVTTLQPILNAGGSDATKALINTVRGRNNCTEVTDLPAGMPGPFGDSEETKKLWAIENSTPTLLTDSKLVADADKGYPSGDDNYGHRDITVFAGAHDGMLHAFHAGKWDKDLNGPGLGGYDNGNGKEIWSYIPSTLLSSLKNQPFIPDPLDYSTFEPAVTVDGSPALGDFLVDLIDSDGNFDPSNGDGVREWRTLLVDTANLRNSANVTQGIIFAMDVTNPSVPYLLWEKTYNDTTDVDADGNPKCTYDNNTNYTNCNMGTPKGVAIGRVQIGTGLQSVIFAVTNWIKPKNPADYKQDCTVNPTDCVQGISAFALDFLTGNILWEQKLPYLPDTKNLSDATDVTATPAIPALMDIDNNGTHDFIVFGDYQGRLWALRTSDGKSMAGTETVSHGGGDITVQEPVFVVIYHSKNLDGDGNVIEGVFGIDSVTKKLTGNIKGGAEEPIGASVSVYKNIVAFGTGGADLARNKMKYHLLVIKISPDFGYQVLYYSQDDPATSDVDESLDYGEKVWAKSMIDQYLNIWFVTASNYYTPTGTQTGIDPDTGESITYGVSELTSTGSIYVVNIREDAALRLYTSSEGGFVGGLDMDSRHVYTPTLKSDIISIGIDTTTGGVTIKNITPDSGPEPDEDFTEPTEEENPFKVLWWKKM